MKRRQQQALFRWLQAEGRGAEETAERELASLWAGLPRPAPEPGFARRALARAGLDPSAARGRGLLPGPAWLPRAALAAALAIVATTITLLPAWLLGLATAGNRLFGASVGLVAALSERLAHGLTAWNVATRISQSLVAALTEPAALAALTAALMMSFFAFGWLRQLLALERRTQHA